jgi:hypothetical protein
MGWVLVTPYLTPTYLNCNLNPNSLRTRSRMDLQRVQQLLKQHRDAVLPRALEEQYPGALRGGTHSVLGRLSAHLMHSSTHKDELQDMQAQQRR